MKVLVDTNIIISALLFPKSKPAKALFHTVEHHQLVFCEQNIRELRDVLNRKASHMLPNAEILLAELSYELIPAVQQTEKFIRDTKDQPILNAAIAAEVDIILTGDKDFLSLESAHPKCVTAAQFLSAEGLT